ncbi:MAG: hypothetical protein AVO38_03425 [delta proteobacterium ML8_D]|nr:MAG: hypothetical protein AVO38_03425 [delta proteobacterium ML8_D]
MRIISLIQDMNVIFPIFRIVVFEGRIKGSHTEGQSRVMGCQSMRNLMTYIYADTHRQIAGPNPKNQP